jgi:hypothetical protein
MHRHLPPELNRAYNLNNLCDPVRREDKKRSPVHSIIDSWICFDNNASNDAKVVAGAAESVEEIRVGCRGDINKLSLGCDHSCGNEVIGREAINALEIADSSTWGSVLENKCFNAD